MHSHNVNQSRNSISKSSKFGSGSQRRLSIVLAITPCHFSRVGWVSSRTTDCKLTAEWNRMERWAPRDKRRPSSCRVSSEGAAVVRRAANKNKALRSAGQVPHRHRRQSCCLQYRPRVRILAPRSATLTQVSYWFPHYLYIKAGTVPLNRPRRVFRQPLVHNSTPTFGAERRRS